jgi:hypothetical protein
MSQFETYAQFNYTNDLSRNPPLEITKKSDQNVIGMNDIKRYKSKNKDDDLTDKIKPEPKYSIIKIIIKCRCF